MSQPEQIEISADLDLDQTRMAAMTLWICLRYAAADMVKTNGVQHALNFQKALILGVKNGDVTMPIHKETETFEFVIGLLEDLISIKGDNKPGDGH
jgi:hypothetical protein